ncbi:DUF6299 family protein [Streptomyces amakusaensis]
MINARRTMLISAACIAAALATALVPGSAGAQFAPDTITIAPRGQIAKDGTLVLSGTYRCSSLRSGPVLIGSNATQGEARAEIDGALATCDDQVHTWRETTDPAVGFAPGKARGTAALIHLDASRSFVPLPVILNTDDREVTLRRG